MRVAVRLALPDWLILQAPTRIARRARSVRLVVRSRFEGAALLIGRRSVPLGLAARTIDVAVPVRPGPVVLRLVARGQGASTPIVLRIARARR